MFNKISLIKKRKIDEKNNRIKFIDIARFFAIFFVVLGHIIGYSKHCDYIFKFLYSFHVGLFFIISGYLFKVKKDESFFTFFKKKFLRIMFPYFFWGFIFIIPYLLFGTKISDTLNKYTTFDIKTNVLNILYGIGRHNALRQNTSLWFLPALFSMEILFYFIFKYVKNIKLYVTLIVLFIIGLVSSNYLTIYLPWGINTVLNVGWLFYLGYYINKTDFISKKMNTYICIILLTIGISTGIINNFVFFVDYEYSNYILAMISTTTISLCIIYMSTIINSNIIMEKIGKHTMGILIFHKIVILIIQTKCGIISDLLKDSNILVELLINLFATMISIMISLIITKILKRFMPILLGEKRL